MLGIEGVQKSYAKPSSLPAHEMKQGISRWRGCLAGRARQTDDVSLMLVHVR